VSAPFRYQTWLGFDESEEFSHASDERYHFGFSFSEEV